MAADNTPSPNTQTMRPCSASYSPPEVDIGTGREDAHGVLQGYEVTSATGFVVFAAESHRAGGTSFGFITLFRTVYVPGTHPCWSSVACHWCTHGVCSTISGCWHMATVNRDCLSLCIIHPSIHLHRHTVVWTAITLGVTKSGLPPLQGVGVRAGTRLYTPITTGYPVCCPCAHPPQGRTPLSVLRHNMRLLRLAHTYPYPREVHVVIHITFWTKSTNSCLIPPL